MVDSDDDTNDMADGTKSLVRSGKGQFDRDPAVVARDAECARLRSRSMSYRQIAEALGISVSMAYEGVRRALAGLVAEPAEAVLEMELRKLDRLERAALRVLEADHEVVYQGGRTGIRDDGPRLAAVATLQRLSESRRKLLGLDQPARVDLSGGVTYEVVGIDPKDLT